MFSTDIMKYNFEEQEQSIYRMTDVPSTHWAAEYIEEAIDKKIVEGYGDGSFKPENKITKAEFMAMLIRTIDYKLEKQNNNGHWFEKQGYLDAAKKLNLITETDYGINYAELRYNDCITRDEMTYMVGNLLIYLGFNNNSNNQISFTDIYSIKNLKEFNIALHYSIINGYPDGTFKPLRHITRAEGAKIIYKFLQLLDG